MSHRQERNRRPSSTDHRVIEGVPIRFVIALVVGVASPGKATSMPSNGHRPQTTICCCFDTVTNESATIRS